MKYRVVSVDVQTNKGEILVDEETVAEFASVDEAIDYLNYHIGTHETEDREMFVEDDLGIVAWSADLDWGISTDGGEL